MALINPFGALGLDDTLQRIVQFLQQISSNLGRFYPDTSGRIVVSVGAGTLPAVTTVTTVTTVSTVSNVGNQTACGGYNTSYDQYAQLQTCAQGVRQLIQVT